MRRTRSLTALLGTAMTLTLAMLGRGDAVRAAAAPVAASGDTPQSFRYGTDSYYPSVSGGAPYSEPVLGGSYGGYMGMVGSWERSQGCSSFLAWSGSDAAAAEVSRSRYREGVGTGAYWFMGGPGIDPHYDGSAHEAGAWGSRQAARMLSAIRALPTEQRVTYPVVWMDIELPKIAPAPDNGWTSVYTSPCGGVVRKHGITPSVNRAEVNGFSDYLRAHSSFLPGVYSSPGDWRKIFGTGADSVISGTYEWTYRPETADLRQAPAGWCLRVSGSRCALFFGGVNSASPYALMWQFSGGGGVLNGDGDFDQIDRSRMPQRAPQSVSFARASAQNTPSRPEAFLHGAWTRASVWAHGCSLIDRRTDPAAPRVPLIGDPAVPRRALALRKQKAYIQASGSRNAPEAELVSSSLLEVRDQRAAGRRSAGHPRHWPASRTQEVGASGTCRASTARG